ncbi:MAG: UDP-3-O-(3-hydroxymyristoyl)glucosamine N-acyltransferase [Planctomycetota bacterium]|jgi:UDP-3-O-[3-hydroxymyristoyl] glucosamine N-acyltransferase
MARPIFTLAELAEALGCRFEGEGATEIRGVNGIEEAGEGELTFLANPRYEKHLQTTRAAAVIVHEKSPELPLPTLRSSNPYLLFARSCGLFHRPPALPTGVHPTAVVDETATLGEGAAIGPYVVIGPEVVIGCDARIHAHVVIYEGAVIGDRFLAHAHAVVRERVRVGNDCVLQPGAVIGGDGYGFAPDAEGVFTKIQQIGTVELGDAVEVQSNSTVDRAGVGVTSIGQGTKSDNLVQIGHGATIGKPTLIAAQTGISGSTTIGNHVTLAGQVGVVGHLTIGDRVTVAAKSGVSNDVKPGLTLSGAVPAPPIQDHRRVVACIRKLPVLRQRLHELGKRVDSLEQGGGPQA